MGKVRQGLYLQEWLEEQRLKRQRRKEREQKRLEKERLEKEEARKKREEKEQKQKAKEEKKLKREREKQQRQQQREEKILHHSIYVQNRTIQIYRTNGRVGKFSSDDELYQTWEELKDAEEKENARLNWTYLPTLIEETKQLINGESKTKRR